jgi:hypothetical protein
MLICSEFAFDCHFSPKSMHGSSKRRISSIVKNWALFPARNQHTPGRSLDTCARRHRDERARTARRIHSGTPASYVSIDRSVDQVSAPDAYLFSVRLLQFFVEIEPLFSKKAKNHTSTGGERAVNPVRQLDHVLSHDHVGYEHHDSDRREDKRIFGHRLSSG